MQAYLRSKGYLYSVKLSKKLIEEKDPTVVFVTSKEATQRKRCDNGVCCSFVVFTLLYFISKKSKKRCFTLRKLLKFEKTWVEWGLSL